MKDLFSISIPLYSIYLECLTALSHSALSVDCLWPILESLTNTVSVTHHLFDPYCELLAGIASRSPADTRQVLLYLHNHSSAPCTPSFLLNTLSISPSLSLIHLFGSLLSVLGEITSDSLYNIEEVCQALFHIIHFHPHLREAAIQALTQVVQDQRTANSLLTELANQGLLSETEPSLVWCMENDSPSAGALLLLLSRVTCYASDLQSVAKTAALLLTSSYLNETWRCPILTFVFCLLKHWHGSEVPEFIAILESDHSLHHYLIQSIPIDSTSAFCSLRLLLLILRRSHIHFSQLNASLLAKYVIEEMDLLKETSSYCLHRLSAGILMLLCKKGLVDWSEQDSGLLLQFRLQLPVYVELAYYGDKKWIALFNTLIYILHSPSGQILFCGSDPINSPFVDSIITHTLSSILSHNTFFLKYLLSSLAILSSTTPDILSSLESVFPEFKQLIIEWSQNPINTPLLSLLELLLHCQQQSMIREAIKDQDLSHYFSNPHLLKILLLILPHFVSDSSVLSQLSSLDTQTRSLCYLLLLKEASLPDLSVQQLMSDAVNKDPILSISAMDILLRILAVSENVIPTISMMMTMEREMSVCDNGSLNCRLSQCV